MAQYISKDALVAEIERRIKCITKEYQESEQPQFFLLGKINGLENILPFLSTLEVKEVDLEKHLKEDIEDVFFDLNGVAVKGATHYLTVEDVKDIAKHFYELCMQVSNKAQKG